MDPASRDEFDAARFFLAAAAMKAERRGRRPTLQERIRGEQFLVSQNRSLRYLLLLVFSYYTLMDAIKLDAYNATLLRTVLPSPSSNWTIKEVSSVLVTSEVSFAAIQVVVIGLIEQYVPPSVWCTINFFLSLAAWFTFDRPNLGLARLVTLFVLKAFNVRYAVMVHWFGARYFKYTMAVQFFVSLLPHIVKLPLFYFDRTVVFGQQFLIGAVAVLLYGLLACSLFWCWRTHEIPDYTGEEFELERRRYIDGFCHPMVDRDVQYKPDKRGSWICNIACTLFLSGVYYDYPMFTTYAKVILQLDITYEMVYVHVGLFTAVFIVNVAYNIFKYSYRRWLRSHDSSMAYIARQMNSARFWFIVSSYLCVLLSRMGFLLLQLYGYPSFLLLVTCACLGGLGGNVQPLLAELMFRQRAQRGPSLEADATATLTNRYYRNGSKRGFYQCHRTIDGIRSGWKNHSDQLFKWMYVDGRSVMNLLLLFVWLAVSSLVGSWWFTVNTISLILLSFTLFLCYYHLHAHRIGQEVVVVGNA
jgi:hypothetical protein